MLFFIVGLSLIILNSINAKFAPLLPLGIGVFLVVFTDRAIADFKKLDWWNLIRFFGENFENNFYSRRTFRIFGLISLLVGIYDLIAYFVPWLV